MTQTAAGPPETTDSAPELPSLSPSRAADFKTCPLRYRLRSIDRLPEQPTVEQVRGTLVHAVLEQLFELPAAGRSLPAATALVAPQWQRLVTEQPLLGTAVPAETADEFLDSARQLLAAYFTLEDPRQLPAGERELLVETVVQDRLRLRGYIDRIDTAAGGALRVVDYKTGGAPREAFETRALFQLKFYALVVWRVRGTVPRVLRLLYLKDSAVCDYRPDAEELLRFERTLLALWQAIAAATTAQDFRAKPSRLCDWCSFQPHCPAFGGTPPPFPAAEVAPRPRSGGGTRSPGPAS